MLRSVSCSEFKDHNGVRKPIIFEMGLNAVVGEESGTNSIGKSTFLMILDFVFGGDDYLTKSKEVHRNVDDHKICFQFIFDGKPYYFYRSTDDPGVVVPCDENYKPNSEGPLKLDKYYAFLKEHYGMDAEGQTWRSAVSRAIRVDRRETLDEDKPFKAAKKETDEDAIVNMLRLFEKYSLVEEKRKAKKAAEDDEDALKTAMSHEIVRNVRNDTEFRRNEERIQTLKAEAADLARKSDNGLLDLSSFQAEQLQEIQNKISGFRRQRTRLRTQLDSLERSKNEGKKKFQKDYLELLEFFPDIDVSKLTQVEDFHRQMSKILSSELAESRKDLVAMIEIAEAEIKQLEEEKVRISQIPNVSAATLEKYADIQKELQELEGANKHHLDKKKLADVTAKKKDELNRTILDEIKDIQKELNSVIKEMNDTLYDVAIRAPRLDVTSSSSYDYYTYDDGGKGMREKGLILFDLACMKTSKLPFVVHDSLLFADIENEVIERLLKLYQAQTDKQVFVAYDKKTTDAAKQIIDSAERIHLRRGGDELFGRSWNREKKEKNDAETKTDENNDSNTEESGQMTLNLGKPDDGNNDN